MTVRLIDRNDTPLAIALVASALVIFQQPLRYLLDVAHDVEARYHIDLIPGLTVLVAVFAFHQYRKWLQAKAAAQSAAAEAALERGRSRELERIVAFGRALGGAVDPLGVRQLFWRCLPAFAGNRELWMLTKKPGGWDTVLPDATASSRRTVDSLEAIASTALTAYSRKDIQNEVVFAGEDICVPMVVGDTLVVGVVGVRNDPPMSPGECRALAAAVALLAIAIRNVHLIERTRETSVRDPLTGCFTRSYALQALNSELRRAKRTGSPVSVLMFDVDNLKTVNDAHGHLAGDAILAAVGQQLNATLRASDVKCRYAGDEFLVVLPDTPLIGAQHAAESVTRDIAAMSIDEIDGHVSPTVSVGVAVSCSDETDPLQLVSRADDALYQAKQSGRNCFVVSVPTAAA